MELYGLCNMGKCTSFCLSSTEACKVILSFLCHSKVPQKSSHAKLGFLQKIKDYASFSRVSQRSSPRPVWKQMYLLLKSRFSSRGSFHPQAALGYLVFSLPAAPPPTTQTPCLTSYHLQPFRISLAVFRPFMVLDSGGIMGINGSYRKK